MKDSSPKVPVLKGEEAIQIQMDLENERANALYYWSLLMNKAN